MHMWFENTLRRKFQDVLYHFYSGNYEPSDFRVMLGTVHRSTEDLNRYTANVIRVQIHPEYENGAVYLGHDIAVLTLAEEVTMSDHIQPICFQNDLDHFSTSSLCYVTGWGFDNFTGTCIFISLILIAFREINFSDSSVSIDTSITYYLPTTINFLFRKQL